MRILIADDEFLVRSTLASMLKDLGLPRESVYEARTGEEMVNTASQCLPDIAIVDIQMPGQNGLEAIKAGKSLSPQTKWYILTGFPKFDYAQEAIRLGVSGYLLKPISPDELKKVLDACAEESRKERTAQNRQFERELTALLYGLTSLEFEGPENFVEGAHFAGGIFYFDSYLSEKAAAERQFAFCCTAQRIISEHLDYCNRLALVLLPNGDLATVGAWEPTQNRQAEQNVHKYFKALEGEARSSCSQDLAITIIETQECSTYQELLGQFELLQELASLRVLCGIGTRLDQDSLRRWKNHPCWLELANHLQTLCRSYHERNHLNYGKALAYLKKFWQDESIASNARLMEMIADFVNHSTGCQLATWQTPKQWIQLLEQHDALSWAEMPREELQNKDLVDQVISFMENNYMDNIGIGQISEQLKITPNYLSTLFHKKTGINFMTYLKKIRMLRAGELLTDPNIQIHQVAERVGYFSSRHFARLFTEHYGCLPSEYRDRFKPN
jgi:two-component system response regulator YesN